MGTARVKQEEEAETRILEREGSTKYVGTKKKSPNQGLTSSEDQTIEVSKGREFLYYRLGYLT